MHAELVRPVPGNGMALEASPARTRASGYSAGPKLRIHRDFAVPFQDPSARSFERMAIIPSDV